MIEKKKLRTWLQRQYCGGKRENAYLHTNFPEDAIPTFAWIHAGITDDVAV